VSETVARCTAQQLARFALRRDAADGDDASSIETALVRMEQSGGDLRETLISLARSDAFLHRRLRARP
jgi:hypothetical protein